MRRREHFRISLVFFLLPTSLKKRGVLIHKNLLASCQLVSSLTVSLIHSLINEWINELIDLFIILLSIQVCYHSISDFHPKWSLWLQAPSNEQQCGHVHFGCWYKSSAFSLCSSPPACLKGKHICPDVSHNHVDSFVNSALKVIAILTLSIVTIVSPPAFLAKIWQTMGTPAINAEASQSSRRPAPQAIFFWRVLARRRATLREFSAGF